MSAGFGQIMYASVFRQFFIKNVSFSRLPPGPVGLPLVGVANKLDPSKVTETLQEWKENYGDIFSFTLPGDSVVVVSFEATGFVILKYLLINVKHPLRWTTNKQ